MEEAMDLYRRRELRSIVSFASLRRGLCSYPLTLAADRETFSTILRGAATLQFGLDRVKGHRGRQYRKIGPQDDHGARRDQIFGHAAAIPIRVIRQLHGTGARVVTTRAVDPGSAAKDR
jgi:hypothetical protein